MKTLKLTAILMIYFQLLINNCYAQSPVDSVGSGCALSFDGVNDYVYVANVINLGHTDAIATLECWVYYSSTLTEQFIISNDRTSWDVGNGALAISSTANPVYYSNYSAAPPFSLRFPSSLTLQANKWNHVALVIDGPNDTYTFYVNGVKDVKPLSFSMNGSVTLYNNISIARIYNYLWGSYYSQTRLDEVCIWNRVLTQTEIQQNMCKKLTGTEPGLVGYWRFDDCGGLTATDASGNGNNGTLY